MSIRRHRLFFILIFVHYTNNNDYSAAEASYKEALEIRRELAKKNRDAYLPDVATTLNNLGNLQSNNNDYSAAEASYKEALEIRRESAKKNRDAYLPNVATTLINLSIFYQDNVPNKELSLKYAKEAVIVLGKCNNTPFVQEALDKAKQVIEKWNNGSFKK